MKQNGKRLLSLLLFVLLSFTACGGSAFQEEAVLKIDGQEIMKSQYMIYLYTTTQSFQAAVGDEVWTMDFDGQTADELVEERTISTIQSVIAAKNYAAENNIAMTEEQKAEAKAATEQFLINVPTAALSKMGAEEEILLPLMEDSYLFALVYDAIAAECDVDEADFAAYYAENQESIRQAYSAMEESMTLSEEEIEDLARELYRIEVQANYAEARINEMIELQTVEKIGDAWESMEVFH